MMHGMYGRLYDTNGVLKEDAARKKRWAYLMEDSDTPLDDIARMELEIQCENLMYFYAADSGYSAIAEAKKPWQLESITTADIASFVRWSLGMMRQVYPLLIFRDLVGVAPMPMPEGKYFYLDEQYGSTKKPTDAGDDMWVEANFNASYAGAFYWDEVGTGDASTTVFDLDNAGVTSGTLEVYLDGVLQTSGYTLGAGTGAGGVDRLTFGSAPGSGVVILAHYEGQSELGAVREAKMSIRSGTITAEAMKLKYHYSREQAQDMKAYFGLSTDTEMMGISQAEMAREWNQLVLLDLIRDAGAGNVNWDASYPAGDTDSAQRRAYRETLWEAVVQAKNLVFDLRYREPDWIVGGTDFVERLEKLEKFQLSPGARADQKTFNQAQAFRGTLPGGMRVYKFPWFPSNKAVIGYRGATPFHAGYQYLPYVPLYMTKSFESPDDFGNTRGLMSRAARVMIEANQYATITVT